MMTKSRDSSQREPKTLLSAFAGWSPQKDEIRRRAFESGLVVLDANILLAFYEVGSAAREEIISILEKQGTRLWVPHQAALEFSRNRSEVVTKRLAQFSDVRRSVKSATTEAIDILEAAISRVLLLRDQNRTARAWDLAAFNLDRDALDHRLDGALDAALEELIKLESEHDTHPSQPDRADEILDRISTLLGDKIGEAFSVDELRSVVDDAMNFRYPNQVPPGYRDISKGNSVSVAVLPQGR